MRKSLTPKKLQLASERIRALTIDQLREVGGGLGFSFKCPLPMSTHPSCAQV